MAHDDLLSMREAADLLGVSMPTFYAIVDERGELRPAEDRTVGRQRRRFFRRSDVEAARRQREGKTEEV